MNRKAIFYSGLTLYIASFSPSPHQRLKKEI